MMKTTSPTHEEIARRAEKIWHDRGSPNGQDTAIWLEAERALLADSQHNDSIEAHSTRDQQSRNLSGAKGRAATARTGEDEPRAAHVQGSATPAASPDEIAAKASLQKSAARAPQQRHGKTAPPVTPTESGKPLWDKPHSS